MENCKTQSVAVRLLGVKRTPTHGGRTRCGGGDVVFSNKKKGKKQQLLLEAPPECTAVPCAGVDRLCIEYPDKARVGVVMENQVEASASMLCARRLS